VGCLWVIGTIWERCGDMPKAEEMYKIILSNLENLFDSKNDVRSASPFELELNYRLSYIAKNRGDMALSQEHQNKVLSLCDIFNIEYNEKQRSIVLNLAMKFLKFHGLSGIRLNYSKYIKDLFPE